MIQQQNNIYNIRENIHVDQKIMLHNSDIFYRFSGAVAGLTYVFLLPCVIYMYQKHKAGSLTWFIIITHVGIAAIGVVNFAAHFVLVAYGQ